MDGASTAVKQHLIKLDGEFKGLRAQFTEFSKRSRRDSEGLDYTGPLRAEQDALKQGLANVVQSLDALRAERAAAEQGLRQEIAALKQSVDADGLRQEIARLKKELAQHGDKHTELHGKHEKLSHHHADIHHSLKKIQGDLGKKDSSPDVSTMTALQSTVQTTVFDLHSFKRQIYDSGVLMPKIEVPPEDDEPPVGTLELGQDVFGAKLLTKLGFKKGARIEEKEEGSFLSTDEEESLSGEHPEDLVSGLQVPAVQPGERGYFALTTGMSLLCAFTQLLQLIALVNIFAYGLEMGSSCVPKRPTGIAWWTLHLSKAAGIVVVGCLSGGDVMDTVNFLMVEVLLERGVGCEVAMSVILRVTSVLLTAVANSVLFIIATSPDGVWLYITAVAFVNDVSRAMLSVAKSGILGHHMAKQVTEINFQLSFVRQYPWWFASVKRVAYVFLFGFIAVFATYVFFLPVQECPADGSAARNIFYHFWPDTSDLPPSQLSP